MVQLGFGGRSQIHPKNLNEHFNCSWISSERGGEVYVTGVILQFVL